MNFLVENWLILLPLLALQVGLAVYCIRKIVKGGVRNLSKPIWIILVLFLNLVGPVLFMLVGQKEA